MKLRLRTATVRFRVTLLATVAVCFVLVLAGTAIVIAQRRLLTENLDERLQHGASNIATALAGGLTPAVLGGFGDDDAFAQVVDGRGNVIAATPGMTGGAELTRLAPPGRPGDVQEIGGLPGHEGVLRVASRTVKTAGGPVVVQVGGPIDDVVESTEVLVTSLVVGIPAVVLLLAVLLWVVVGRTLRPVEAMRAEVDGISGSDLHRRVPEPGAGDEISRLARTMNAMLDRVENAVSRQRRFVADASHELRSPLTRIRAELEVDLAHPDRADLLATHRSVLAEATGLQRLAEDLLHLASGGAGSLRRQPVDLDDIVLRVADGLRADGRVDVDTTGVAAAQVLGDRGQLERAVGNLADNAARHASGRVALSVAESGAVALVTVVDDGPGIPPGEEERVFDRFTRLDESRDGSAGGAGLGLAIAREAVVRHGGTLIVDPDHRPGARFVITLPLPDVPDSR